VNERRAEIAARSFVTVGALLPYWRFLTFRVIYITDDWLTSDIFDGEFPGRVLIGNLIRHGQLPVWTKQLCSGLPLVGSPADPVGLAAFSLLPPAAALDLLVIVMLLVAAHGAYGLARRFGANRSGAALAAIAFAGSGYIACQLKHLSIISTVVWLPVGLSLLDRALRADPAGALRQRTATAAFGLVFALQALAGFPQSAYICGLVYCSFAIVKTLGAAREIRWPHALAMLARVGIAALLGALAGAVVLLPLAALTRAADTAGTLGWEWAAGLVYWPRNVISFLIPYFHGDISNNTYTGPPIFWEDYGYVGAATFLLAIYGAIRERRRPLTAFAVGMTSIAYLLVLGRRTPFFHAAYLLVPGMKLFRAPTRFLVVVDLGLAVLGAIGLTRVANDLSRRFIDRPWLAPSIAAAICTITLVDLFVHQPRQNPIVPARQWLAAPATVRAVHGDTSEPRTFTPAHRLVHGVVFREARGWANVTPYFELRDTLEPNTGGGLWDTASSDCYAGVSPRWYVDVWGWHNREASMMSELARPDFERRALLVNPVLPNVLRAYGVTHLVSRYPQQGARLTAVPQEGRAFVYRIDDGVRVRIVQTAQRVSTDREAVVRLMDPRFDPNREVLLHDAPPATGRSTQAADSFEGHAAVRSEDSRNLIVTTDSSADAFLLVADTFYPGWSAGVDGTPTPVYRANVSVRAIQLPKGHHEVRFTYDPPWFFAGLWLTAIAGGTLVVWLGLALHAERRARR
jgi:membrane protein YfhO